MFHLISRAAVLALVLTITACASIQPPSATATSPNASSRVWSGRMAVKVEGAQAQSFSAAFELRGSPEAGQLLLSTPLGSALGSIEWSAGQATLKSNGETRQYPSLDALIVQVMGTSVPVEAMFDWLDGKNLAVSGWQVDSSELQTSNRLFARRDSPAPVTELRLVLDSQ